MLNPKTEYTQKSLKDNVKMVFFKLLSLLQRTDKYLIIYIVFGVFYYNLVTNFCNRWGENLKYYSKIRVENIAFLRQEEVDIINPEINPGNSSNNTFNQNYNIDYYLNTQKNIKIDENQKQRIKDQIYLIRNRAVTSLRIARDLHLWMVHLTTMALASTIVAALCAYFMIKGGWDNIGNETKRIFIISLGFSLFSTSMCSVYQLNKNAKKMLDYYQAYINLEEYVFTSLAVGYLSNDDSKKSDQSTTDQQDKTQTNYPDNLIVAINHVLESYSVQMEVDSSSIPKFNDVIKSVELNSYSK